MIQYPPWYNQDLPNCEMALKNTVPGPHGGISLEKKKNPFPFLGIAIRAYVFQVIDYPGKVHYLWDEGGHREEIFDRISQ